MVAKVFISHASQDRACARQLRQWLISGHEVFLDQDLRDGIVVGEEWEQRLHERLRWADAVVCVVTSAAVASTWCTAGISIGLSLGRRVLPVRAELGVDHPLLTSAPISVRRVGGARPGSCAVVAGKTSAQRRRGNNRDKAASYTRPAGV